MAQLMEGPENKQAPLESGACLFDMARLGGLFGPTALTPSGPPSLCSGVPQPTAWVSVEPLSVQILPAIHSKTPQPVGFTN